MMKKSLRNRFGGSFSFRYRENTEKLGAFRVFKEKEKLDFVIF